MTNAGRNLFMAVLLIRRTSSWWPVSVCRSSIFHEGFRRLVCGAAPGGLTRGQEQPHHAVSRRRSRLDRLPLAVCWRYRVFRPDIVWLGLAPSPVIGISFPYLLGQCGLLRFDLRADLFAIFFVTCLKLSRPESIDGR
jgi:hypothetical protein